MPLGLTDRDRQEIRTGRNKTIGARHATILFWGPIWGRLLLIGGAIAVVIYLAVKARDLIAGVWGAGLGTTVSDGWPLIILGVLFAVLLLGWARGSGPRRRRRHRRRR